MKKYDVIIIGGSAAGVTAAITARRHYPGRSILVLRKEKQVPIPCGIPYIFGTVESPQMNIIPDKVLTKNNIDFEIGSVSGIDRKNKVVSTDESVEFSYEKLVISTGSNPVELPIPGIRKENVFVVKKDIPYLTSLLESMEKFNDLVIIGGGFIGVEFADECRKNRDINISIVELLPHCLLLGFDEVFCGKAEEDLLENGIKIYRNISIEEIVGEGKVSSVKLSDGTLLKADAVIVSVGARPNVEIAQNAGIEVSKTGAVKVDKYMRTSDPDIFACGDCSESISFFTGKPIPLLLASVATMEARIAGANLFGLRRSNPGEIGVFSTKVGNTAMGSAGLTERKAREFGFEVVTGEAKAANRHPGVMPGMKEIGLKLIFNRKNMVLLGAQAIGADCVGEFINILSACIQHKKTADDIAIYQIGTHPALTASPIAYQLVSAAEMAIQNACKMKE